MSDIKYQKINTLFMRDDKNVIMPDQYCRPEFEYLKDLKWECTEKIDGTNMRVIITPVYESAYNAEVFGMVDKFSHFDISVVGKSDNSSIPKHLLTKIEEIFQPWKIEKAFAERYVLTEENPEKNLAPIILYGEGYGAKIQKGGNYIPDGVDFILFDVKVGDIWLLNDKCRQIADQLKIKAVPFVGLMTIPEAIDYVKKGFISNISHNREYIAEGLVLKTPYGLMDRMGERLILKIKYKDFMDLERKAPRTYPIYKRIDDVVDAEMERIKDKKESLNRLKEYKSNDPCGMYLIKEINEKTGEIYHEIYE